MLDDLEKLLYLFRYRPFSECLGYAVDFWIAPWHLRWAYEAEVEFQNKLNKRWK